MLDGVTGDVGGGGGGGGGGNGGGESGEEEEMRAGPQQLHADAPDAEEEEEEEEEEDDDYVAASAFKLNANPALTKAPLSPPASSQGLPGPTNPSSELTSLGKGQLLALASWGCTLMHVCICLIHAVAILNWKRFG